MKMIVTDLDGTLLRSDKSISPRTSAVLEKLNAQGIKIVIATARPPRLALNILPEGWQDTYVICYNGAEIYHNGYSIYKKCIDAGTVKAIVDQLCAAYPGIRLSLEIENHLFTNFDIRVIPEWKTPYTQVNFYEFAHHDAAKILVDLSGLTGTGLVASIVPSCCSMVITDKGLLGQITHCDVSKIDAVRHLVNRFGYRLSDVIAFGDDYNDLDMISECGTGVAMGNGEKELMLAADIIADTNDNDGVACILEQFIA
jgi:Cof subfamily protein (haloacid dehalogenase superfamily)